MVTGVCGEGGAKLHTLERIESKVRETKEEVVGVGVVQRRVFRKSSKSIEDGTGVMGGAHLKVIAVLVGVVEAGGSKGGEEGGEGGRGERGGEE